MLSQFLIQDDLWRALTRAAHLSRGLAPTQTVKDIMDTWTLQVSDWELALCLEVKFQSLVNPARFSFPRWGIPL